jgi:3-vinyl bacteriochlorophyllide hydratase
MADTFEVPRVTKAPIASRKSPTISHHSAEALSINLYNSRRGKFTHSVNSGSVVAVPLYTPEERRRRDTSPWTIVQGVLAPLQFFVFLLSLCLVIRYLATGDGLALATTSVVVKTIALYAIMITGSIWEHEVFGRYLFARPFFWEDLFSILVLALHTIYLAALVSGTLSPRNLMVVALAAYTTYVINATQFLLKLRAARQQQSSVTVSSVGLAS